MRYFFSGKIEKENNIYQIRIPFNVWEVSDKRDVIAADIFLDNEHIFCNLMPIQKGKYIIHLSDEKIANININVEHKIALNIDDSIIQKNLNSPYSFENPIRKIEKIDLIIQPVDGLCSQTCIAMLAGVTIAEVISVMGLQEWQAKMGDMISALNYYGLKHSEVVNFTDGREDVILPDCCIMMEKMGLYCHYLLHYKGEFYDPNMPVFTDYDMSKLQGYLEVKCD